MESIHSVLFAFVPLMAWVASGTVKFVVNSIRYGKEAMRLVGNGGFPSTHTSVVSSITMLIGLTSGWNSPLFGLGVALTCIVMIDALGVRRAVGETAKRINALSRQIMAQQYAELRERQGHTKTEVLGGLVVGTLVAWLVYLSIT
jgi:acid phosphatase family membrane protein YuiD